MEQKEKLIIPIEQVWETFQNHLTIENNNRILFSWKYWTWKTYFLNDFFKFKNEEYEVFHLYPINYQISQNESIIKFLKYDILVELLNKNPNIFENIEITSFLDYNILTYLFFSDNNNILKSLKTWIEFIPELGRPISETVWIFEKFSYFKKKLKSWEKWIIDDFIKEIKNNKITESDLISELVKNKIKELKWSKKSVLVLDDLDRIDPEHIFRLLNIFWAHYDNKNNDLPNKFWFDKIILVCDYENIKSIFHHKYWKEADFNWYIDKFFSIETFKFDNNLIIDSFIKTIISNYNVAYNWIHENIKNNSSYYWLFLDFVLRGMVNIKWSSKINLRELLKPVNFYIAPLKSVVIDSDIWMINLIIQILLTTLWWDKDRFFLNLKHIKQIYIKNDRLIKQLNYVYENFIIEIYSKINNYNYEENWNSFNNFEFSIKNNKIEILKWWNIKELFFEILIYYIQEKL